MKSEATVKNTMVYQAEDIMEMLKIGRSKAYQLIKEAYETQEPFRVIKVGNLLRVPRESFDTWISGK